MVLPRRLAQSMCAPLRLVRTPCRCTTRPALRVTGINISNGARGQGRGNSAGGCGCGQGAVRVCKHADVRQCAVLASRERGCASFSLLPPPPVCMCLARYARLAAYPSASPPFPFIPCLSLSPRCLPIIHLVLTRCREGTPSKASASQQGISTNQALGLKQKLGIKPTIRRRLQPSQRHLLPHHHPALPFPDPSLCRAA